MADFVESAKNMVSKAVSRTSWEAQKQMRVRGKQGEIDKLVDQRHRLLDELGQVAMNLYQQGTLSDAQLGRICASIMELDHDVKNREEQLQELKKEPFPADQSTPGPVTDYSPPAYAPSASPRKSGGPAPASQGQTVCPTCGSTVRSNSLYCRSCGTKLR